MKRLIEFNEKSRTLLKRGVDGLAKAVSVTLGPKGRNVVIKKGEWSGHSTTKDGVTVAKEIYFDEPIVNLGAEMVKNVAINTVNDAGDGTTTSIVLAQAILHQGINTLKEGSNLVMVNNGIQKAIKHTIELIKNLSIKISAEKEVVDVATISCNNDVELGSVVGKAMFSVGENGSVICKKSNSTNTTWEVSEGMIINSGLINGYFINKPSNMSCVLDNPLIVIYNQNIKKVHDLLHLIEYCISVDRPIVFICNDMDGEALQFMITNTVNGKIKSAVIKAPYFGDNKINTLEDIGILTGAMVCSENNGVLLKDVSFDMLGTCDRIEINQIQTKIIGKNTSNEIIEKRISDIKTTIENSNDKNAIKEFKDRISRLSGKIGVIYLGATSDLEYKERLDRVEDAIGSTKASMEEGIVPGGGICLLYCKKELNNLVSEDKDEQLGIKIVKNALEEPIKKILENAGLESKSIIDEINSKNSLTFGYNARIDKYVDNMLDEGIIDPAKVTRCALQNAGSIAGLILTTECVIIDVTEFNNN